MIHELSSLVVFILCWVGVHKTTKKRNKGVLLRTISFLCVGMIFSRAQLRSDLWWCEGLNLKFLQGLRHENLCITIMLSSPHVNSFLNQNFGALGGVDSIMVKTLKPGMLKKFQILTRCKPLCHLKSNLSSALGKNKNKYNGACLLNIFMQSDIQWLAILD